MQQIMQHLMCIHLECENAIRQSQGLGLFSWSTNRDFSVLKESLWTGTRNCGSC